MALVLGDNFSYQGSKPLDARLKYDTIASMKAVADATLYDGCMAYVTATKKNYQWDSTNEVDETLGKWRELETGGGHAVEDSEGTILTQRDTMQFGNGFNATDDSENEKTVVEPNLMAAEDMDDVVTPLPSVKSRYHKYSTEEQIVGEWIDGKPIYSKTYTGTTPSTVSSSESLKIPMGVSIERVIDAKAVYFNSNGTHYVGMLNITTNVDKCIRFNFQSNSHPTVPNIYEIYCTQESWCNLPYYLTVFYTKTTD